MGKHKFLALVMAAVLVLGLTACKSGNNTGTTEPTATEAPATTQAPTAEPTSEAKPTPTPAVKVDPSVDFEDGNMDFVAVFESFATADASTIEIADFNGSKALKITKGEEKKTPVIAIDIYSLLGDKAADVASLSMELGTTFADGSFSATSGQIVFWTEPNLAKMPGSSWSVFMANKNPYTVKTSIPEGVTLGADVPLTLIYFKEDLGAGTEHGPATLYVDNIAFLDKDGNTIKPASTEVAFNAPSGFSNEKEDRTNLVALGGAVELAGFNPKSGAWAQDGAEMTQEFIDALVPGSTIEFSYSSGDGKIWLVFPNATVGWSRVGDGKWAGNEHTEVYRNSGNTVAQVDYDQLVALMGEDKSTWGTTIQCEGSSDWEVFSIKVGTATEEKEYVKTLDFDGFATTGGGWGQNGFDIPQEIWDALVPGSVIELNYASEDGTLWVVFPDAAAGWSRVGDGDFCGNGHDPALLVDESKCYVTYEQIAALCGDDKTTWGARLQAEARTNWEVFSVSVGTFKSNSAIEYTKILDFDGFATTGGGWGQNGFDIPQEIFDALVPGTAIELNYASEDGTLWAVFPDAAAGWSRVSDGDYCGNGHSAAILVDGSKCYVPYEQIVEICGEDKTLWGARLQAEARTNWEVFSVSVGTLSESVSAPRLHDFTEFEGFATTGGGWGQNGFDIPQAIWDALVPGSVIELDYTSEDGTLWVVFPDAAAGWSRAADGDYCGNGHSAAILVDGSKCYVPYEQIVEVCGEDKSTWGARLQAEARTNWEVFAVRVGQK
ncbi:MAG: hypothetical protein J6Y89_06610 [Lachnospiraceae bacterium]|nr:hypothetical protein [Lachnospiraceae bacterium]